MNNLENSSAKSGENLEIENKNDGKTSESNKLVESKINNVHIENNSKTTTIANGYLNALNVPNYDNFKRNDFSKNKEQSNLKKKKILPFKILSRRSFESIIFTQKIFKTLESICERGKQNSKPIIKFPI